MALLKPCFFFFVKTSQKPVAIQNTNSAETDGVFMLKSTSAAAAATFVNPALSLSLHRSSPLVYQTAHP